MSQDTSGKSGLRLPGEEVFKSALANLKEHPKETFACVALFSVIALFYWGVNPWFAAGAPCSIYLLYILSHYIQNRHTERLLELQATKTENVIGTRARTKARRTLEKRGRNGKP